ncbi:MAG: hypothetical protein EOO45_12650, partial [Flavobacterium sp.]
EVRLRGNGTVDPTKKPLYVVDGEVARFQDLNHINPEKIMSVNIIKGAAAAGKYVGENEGN